LYGGLGYLSAGFSSACSLIVSSPFAIEGASDAVAPATAIPAPPTTFLRERETLLSVMFEAPSDSLSGQDRNWLRAGRFVGEFNRPWLEKTT